MEVAQFCNKHILYSQTRCLECPWGQESCQSKVLYAFQGAHSWLGHPTWAAPSSSPGSCTSWQAGQNHHLPYLLYISVGVLTWLCGPSRTLVLGWFLALDPMWVLAAVIILLSLFPCTGGTMAHLKRSLESLIRHSPDPALVWAGGCNGLAYPSPSSGPGIHQ